LQQEFVVLALVPQNSKHRVFTICLVSGGFVPRRWAAEEGTNREYQLEKKCFPIKKKKKDKYQNVARYSELGSTATLCEMEHEQLS